MNTPKKLTPDMGEISGFGGGYEAACIAMVEAGIKWLDDNPSSDPQFHGYKGLYGIIQEDNKDAEALTSAVLTGCDDCTGAMHQAAVSHCMAYKRLGWDEYCKQRRENHAKQATA